MTELISAVNRRMEEERNRKLLEPARSRVRSDYRIAGIHERAIDEVLNGEVGSRHLDQFLLNSEALGFRGSLNDSMSALRSLESGDARRRANVILERVVMFAGNDAAAFRELYDDLAWLFDALKDRELDEMTKRGREIERC